MRLNVNKLLHTPAPGRRSILRWTFPIWSSAVLIL